MAQESSRTEAWVVISSEMERRAQTPPEVIAAGYDYGFLPAMGRLLSAHKEIGPAFGRHRMKGESVGKRHERSRAQAAALLSALAM